MVKDESDEVFLLHLKTGSECLNSLNYANGGKTAPPFSLMIQTLFPGIQDLK